MSLPPLPKPVQEWCLKHGHTEPFLHEGQWWAFPPNGVNPVPLPIQQRRSDIRSSPRIIRRKLANYCFAYCFCLMFVFLIYKAFSLPIEFFIGFAGGYFCILVIRSLILISDSLLR